MRKTTAIMLIWAILATVAAGVYSHRADEERRLTVEISSENQKCLEIAQWYQTWEHSNAPHAWYVWDPESDQCMFCGNTAIYDEYTKQKAFCGTHSDCFLNEDGGVLGPDKHWLWLKWNLKIKAYEVTGHGQPPHGDPQGTFDRAWVDLSIPLSEAFNQGWEIAPK